MQTASLTEWLNSPETRALVTYLRFRRAPGLAMFLQGLQVAPEIQARSAGANEILRLLREPPEHIADIFENAAKEMKSAETSL